MKIIHMIGQLDPGGIETWLLHLVDHWKNNQEPIESTIVVQKKTGSDFERCFEKLNVKVVELPLKRGSMIDLFGYFVRVYKFLRSEDSYDIMHSHLQYFSGITSAIAWLAGLKGRIVHSHNSLSVGKNYLRRTYFWISKKMIQLFSNKRLAVSKEAGEDLFVGKENQDYELHCWGFDFSRYDPSKTIKSDIRDELGLSKESPCFVHVGRLVHQKNHDFLIDMFNLYLTEYSTRHPDKELPNLILVGKGVLESKIKSKVNELNLSGNVYFLGSRLDVPDILRVADIFLLPSHHEGLPVVVLEAQAAGIPVLMSNVVTSEAIVASDLVKKLPLDNISKWIEAVEEYLRFPRTHEPNYYRVVASSRFSVKNEADVLLSIYKGLVKS